MLNKKGNTHSPQPPEEDVDDPEDGVVDPDRVDEDPSWHVLDSSPRAANMNLFWVITAALLDTPATPVGVPVAGSVTAGLE